MRPEIIVYGALGAAGWGLVAEILGIALGMPRLVGAGFTILLVFGVIAMAVGRRLPDE